MLRPLVSSAANVAGRRRLRCSMGIIPGLACRQWLTSDSSTAAPTPTPGATAGTDGRTWTWSTPSPNRPGRGGAEIPVIPRCVDHN